jgi:hypothetical protein
MKTELLRLMECKRILDDYKESEGNEQEVIKVIEGLLQLIKNSEQDEVLIEAIQTFCDFLFNSSFFTEETKQLFMRTLHEEAQKYGWGLAKTMIN